MNTDERKLDITGASNGDTGVFDIDAITEMIVPFEYDFEGFKIKGRWYKYKTITPEWAAGVNRRFNERVERFLEIREKQKTATEKDTYTALNREKAELEDEALRSQYEWLADTIVEWNIVSKGVPVPIESVKLKSFPIPLLVGLGKHLEDDRTGANPTLSPSTSTS